MNKLALVARILLGLAFAAFSIMFFFTTPPPVEGDLGTLTGLMYKSGWLHIVKVLELVGGLLLLSGRLVPLGIVLLGPILVNIMIVHLLYDPTNLVLPAVLCLLEVYLIKVHWATFGPVFKL